MSAVGDRAPVTQAAGTRLLALACSALFALAVLGQWRGATWLEFNVQASRSSGLQLFHDRARAFSEEASVWLAVPTRAPELRRVRVLGDGALWLRIDPDTNAGTTLCSLHVDGERASFELRRPVGLDAARRGDCIELRTRPGATDPQVVLHFQGQSAARILSARAWHWVVAPALWLLLGLVVGASWWFRNSLRAYMARLPAEPRLARAWLLGGAVLAAWFGLWWLHLSPGVFSFDSGFYLQQVVSGQLSDHKPFMYGRFLQLTSLGGRWFEASVLVQAGLVVLVLSRAFAIGIARRVAPVVLAVCAMLVLNPYVVNMAYYVNNDVLFSFAIIALLVETLYLADGRRPGLASYAMLALFSPIALAFRQNGWLFLPLLLPCLAFLVRPPDRYRLVLVSAGAAVLAYTTIIGVDRYRLHDAIFPAVIHETVRLAQPGDGQGLGERLSPETRSAVGLPQLNAAVPLYFPLYWDALAFAPEGPQLGQLPPGQRTRIMTSFFRHDLLPNLPSIIAHRVELLSGALLARAVVVDPYGSPANLPARLGAWKTRQGAASRDHGPLGHLNAASMRTHDWTWNAMLGLIAMVGMTLAATWRRNRPMLVALGLLWVQAAAVLGFAPSAEYRYVFMIYLAPLLLLAGGETARARWAWPRVGRAGIPAAG